MINSFLILFVNGNNIFGQNFVDIFYVNLCKIFQEMDKYLSDIQNWTDIQDGS